jgi:hypothetical protein
METWTNGKKRATITLFEERCGTFKIVLQNGGRIKDHYLSNNYDYLVSKAQEFLNS